MFLWSFEGSLQAKCTNVCITDADLAIPGEMDPVPNSELAANDFTYPSHLRLRCSDELYSCTKGITATFSYLQ